MLLCCFMYVYRASVKKPCSYIKVNYKNYSILTRAKESKLKPYNNNEYKSKTQKTSNPHSPGSNIIPSRLEVVQIEVQLRRRVRLLLPLDVLLPLLEHCF